MKKILIIMALVALAFSFFKFIGSQSEGFWVCDKNGRWVKQGSPTYPQPIVSCSKTPLSTSKENCLKIGGVWKKQGIEPVETYNRKTVDRGNLCRDSRECEGYCQVDLTRDQLRQGMQGKLNINKKFGQCSVWTVELGCQARMEKGKVQVICID